MRSILVIERKHLFPGLSPQGFLPTTAVDLDTLQPKMFFAERDYMEQNSHFKQIIPYLVIGRGQNAAQRILCYQRRSKHTESRLGGLWSIGFGGHIEPLDRGAPEVAEFGLLKASALRELEEETGLTVKADALLSVGFINSDAQAVSSVHFGSVMRIATDDVPGSDATILETVSTQAEPHRALWLKVEDLRRMLGDGDAPDNGSFEDWSRILISGLFS